MDGMALLNCKDPDEALIMYAVARRAVVLQQQQRQELARAIRNEIASMLDG